MENIWYFAYGKTADINRLKDNKIKIYDSKPVIARGYQISFNSIAGNNPMISTNNLDFSDNGYAEGLAILIDDKGLKRLNKIEKYPKNKRKINVVIEFRDKRDKQKKLDNAITYVSRDSFKRGNSIGDKSLKYNLGRMAAASGKNGIPFVMSRIKNQNKNFKWENTSKSNSYVMTFEQYKEKNNE